MIANEAKDKRRGGWRQILVRILEGPRGENSLAGVK